MPRFFELQGHRGARGLRPENTLPSFEIAFDLGVSAVETDVHFARDGIPILYHDPVISDRLCRRISDSSGPKRQTRSLISSLSLAEIRHYAADRNPDVERFPDQEPAVTPLAQRYAAQHGFDPFSPPTVADLFALAAEYCGDLGRKAGKTEAQQGRVRRIRFDLELKRVPYQPELIGDFFDGTNPGLLEETLVKIVRAAGVVARTTVRSFDHRAVLAVRRLEASLTGAVLVSGTAPVSPSQLASAADAQIYCPDFAFLDQELVREAQREGLRVIPWTVNQPEDWKRLIDWRVDGITTDYPHRLAKLLMDLAIEF
jgi:glycerophosphoryl diester phosphodiesterase